MTKLVLLDKMCVQKVNQPCLVEDPVWETVSSLANAALSKVDKSTCHEAGEKQIDGIINAKSCRDCEFYSKNLLDILNKEEKECNRSD